MKPTVTLSLILALAAMPAFATDPHPAVTVEPGTVSMSAGASHDLIETLKASLNPQEMESVLGFMRYALASGMAQRKVVMPLPLARRLDALRTQLVSENKTEAVRSLDVTLGPWVRSAIKAESTN